MRIYFYCYSFRFLLHLIEFNQDFKKPLCFKTSCNFNMQIRQFGQSSVPEGNKEQAILTLLSPLHMSHQCCSIRQSQTLWYGGNHTGVHSIHKEASNPVLTVQFYETSFCVSRIWLHPFHPSQSPKIGNEFQAPQDNQFSTAVLAGGPFKAEHFVEPTTICLFSPKTGR